MVSYLLGIQGVNMDAVVNDTNQLSVSRGSSLMLRELVREKTIVDLLNNWEERPAAYQQCTCISDGASIGLYELVLELDGPEAECAATRIRDYLAQKISADERYRHLTGVIDIQRREPGPEGFAPAREKLIARNRFRQFRQPTLSLADLAAGTAPCAWDNARPVHEPSEQVRRRYGLELARCSPSTNHRHAFGRERKQSFFREETDSLDLDVKFTNDLGQIACDPRGRWQFLGDKIAVLYADGNKFSNVLQATAGKDEYRKFDQAVQNKRREFLRKLVERAAGDEDFKLVDNGKERIQIEILMWGGDEFLIVVPAWQGFQTLRLFFETTANWEYKDKTLTHAASLLFCHHKVPIERIRRVAGEIADDCVKANLPEDGANAFDYLILESVDYPTEPIKQFWNTRLPALHQTRNPLRIPTDWDLCIGNMNDLRESLPRRQLYRVALAAAECRTAGAEPFRSELQRLKDLLGSSYSGVEQKIDSLVPRTAVRSENWQWIHLLEWWDYFFPEPVETPDRNN